MQFKSEYVFTIIRIMFNMVDKKLTQILGILKKIISKEFQKIL